MFKRISYLLLLMLYTFLGYSQGLLRYEYWIDSDFSKRTIVNHSAEDISFNVPYEKMSQGAHFLNFRAQGVNGEWGTFCRYLFLVPEPSTSSTAAIGYEYWFDNNTQQRTFGNTNNGLVSITPDISQLEEGAHFFNIRIINNEGTWSNVYRYLFIRNESMSKSANSDLCEYWFDDNYTKRQNVVVSNGQLQTLIDISPLDDGNVHYLNVRVKNTENVWGSITRYLVFMPNDVLSTNSPLVGYQYGFNGQMTYVPISERQSFAIENLVVPIPDLLQAGTIDSGCKFTFNQPEGKVTMNREGSITFTLLFKNKTGRWTSPYCEDIKQTDQQIRDLLPMSVGKPIKTQKVDNGDFIAFEMQITDPRDYYIHASQTCRIDIYESNGSK